MSFGSLLNSGVRQFRDHPQLWLTVLVALVFLASYGYVTNRFVAIAQDAQDRLVNVRVGALHDAFVPLAQELIDEEEVLIGYMHDIATRNPTITDLLLLEERAGGWQILFSLDKGQELTRFFGYDTLLSLAKADPLNSFTVEEVKGGERFFFSVRNVEVGGGKEAVVVATRQTLSQADKHIAASIRSGMIVLVVVLLFLLLLFFRHARIIDYTVLYRKLKEVDTMKDDFIAMASHELRAPLTAIRGYTEMLRDTGEVQSKEGTLYIDRVTTSASSLDTLISDILDVTRIEQGRLSFEFEMVDPIDTIVSVCESMEHGAAQKSLDFTHEVKAGAHVLLDEARFRQVITNLVSNAVKYTQKGSVAVTAGEEGGEYVVRVRDSGIGMSAEQQTHLFEKFYRAPGEETRAQVGTGLGLWITKKIIERMHGTISIESIQGVGTHFIVRFPLG